MTRGVGNADRPARNSVRPSAAQDVSPGSRLPLPRRRAHVLRGNQSIDKALAKVEMKTSRLFFLNGGTRQTATRDDQTLRGSPTMNRVPQPRPIASARKV